MAHDLDFERELHRSRETAPAGSLFDTYADKVMRRVDDVLAGRDCPWPPSEQDKHFLRLLRSHQGKQRAVALGELCERIRITPRTGKDIVQDLRQSFGVQIGASRGATDGGYYLISCAAESAESTRQMVNQAITMLRVASKMRGGSQHIEQLLEQLELGLTQQGDKHGNAA